MTCCRAGPYLARLPSAEQLAALGVRHVLYVNRDGGEELDDLNHALGELAAGGVDVRTLALADFTRGAPLEEPAIVADPEPADVYWYGGTPEWHASFWGWYGWYRPSPVVWTGPGGHRHCVHVGPPQGEPPRSHACYRVPAARPTVFNSFHGASPSFGHVAVAHHGGGGRSGSLGRAGGGHAS